MGSKLWEAIRHDTYVTTCLPHFSSEENELNYERYNSTIDMLVFLGSVSVGVDQV